MVTLQCSAILFDLDGTLIDSTAAVVAHWTQFADENSLDPAVILATSHGRRSYEILQEHAPHKANWEYIKSLEADIPRRYGDKAIALPGAIDLLTGIERLGGKWGIVTSGTSKLAEQWLEILKIPIPDVFITADFVKDGKPSPEGYLLGRERLGVTGSLDHVLVFEDAVAGVRAGKAAGATVVAVIETYSKEALVAAGADYVLEGLDKVRIIQGDASQMTLELEII